LHSTIPAWLLFLVSFVLVFVLIGFVIHGWFLIAKIPYCVG